MLSTVDDVLKDITEGKIIIVIDDENRENEGDLICAAQFATPENINFMAVYGRGLICMPVSEGEANRLGLEQMVTNNTDNHSTAFTVSVDYKDTTTGISAIERSVTAVKISEKGSRPEDFRRPGHMFPLVAKKNGVIERRGHTEATIDLMKLAKLTECGVCCEIIRDDGQMARKNDLIKFAERHRLKMITIAELADYLKINKSVMIKTEEVVIPTKYGAFSTYAYINKLTGNHHVALVKGDLSGKGDVMCRIHSECLTGDTFGSLRCDCGEQLNKALSIIADSGCGVLIYMRQEGRGIGLVNKLRAYALQETGMDTVEANLALGFDEDMRDYYEAAQIIRDLGITSVRLMTDNPDKIKQLDRYGIVVSERIEHHFGECEFNRAYMETKKTKMGHLR